MTTARSRTAGGRGGGRGAAAPPASRLPRLDTGARRLLAGGLVAATATGGLVTFASLASAGTPPAGPGNIEIFAKRDMVALEGYTAQAGQTATVTVIRGTERIGIGTGTIDPTGFLEFNHPGGECWIGVTPNITGGDKVEVSFSGEAFTDGATVSSAVIGSVTPTETPTAATDDFDHFVTIKGTYGEDVDPGRFVVEIVNPDLRDAALSPVGERALGWVPNDDPADPHNGGPNHSSTGTFADGAFEATFGFRSASDQALAMAGEHVALSWMADGAGDLALGATQYEFGETDGPGFGGCPSGPGAQAPAGPSTAQLASATGTTSITATWENPAQPADGAAVTEYRVSAKGGDFAEQEVAERTSGTTVSLDGLKADATYEVFVEAYNGQWSLPTSVGTIAVGSGASTGGTTPPGGETPPPATEVPTAPTGVAATANAGGGVDVTWIEGTGAASYEVTATPQAADTVAPVTTTVQAPATAGSLSGLTAGTAYTVSVTAVNTAGKTTAVETATVTTNAAAAPAGFTLTRVLPGHERIQAEWTAAAPGNAASPVGEYVLTATPADGGAAVTASTTGLTGTVTGLRNGIEYAVTVVARSGSAATTSAVPANVDNTVTPNDVVTIGGAQFRADRNEYRVNGTAQDTTQNSVTVRTSAGATVGTATVGADGAWVLNVRNGPALPAGATLTVTSTSGANLTGVSVTRR